MDGVNIATGGELGRPAHAGLEQEPEEAFLVSSLPDNMNRSLEEAARDDNDVFWKDDRIEVHSNRLFFAIHDP